MTRTRLSAQPLRVLGRTLHPAVLLQHTWRWETSTLSWSRTAAAVDHVLPKVAHDESDNPMSSDFNMN